MGCFSIFVWLGMRQEQKKNPFEKVSQVGQSKNLKVIASGENKYLPSQLKTINSEHKIIKKKASWFVKYDDDADWRRWEPLTRLRS